MQNHTHQNRTATNAAVTAPSKSHFRNQGLSSLCSLVILAGWAICSPDSSASSINVLDFGAVPDDGINDAPAFQAAFDVTDPDVSEVEIPPGKYDIGSTLNFTNKLAWTIKGSGPTYLVWKGAAGGTLMNAIGSRGCTFTNLYFDGNNKSAGVLLWMKNGTNVNMQNLFNHVSFVKAQIGIQFGTAIGDVCCSDATFNYVAFASLGTGMYVANSQGVDFDFDYIFAASCDKVFHFYRGGNLLVNDAQLTDCGIYLRIEGSGPTNGTFVSNHIRMERGTHGRSQLLVANDPSPFLANIFFTGVTDAQWNWAANTEASRNLPFLDIGPRTTVTIQNSIFQGPPFAKLSGFTQPAATASLVTRECMFVGFNPATDATVITANATGYYQLINNFDGVNALLPNVQKWPSIPTVMR